MSLSQEKRFHLETEIYGVLCKYLPSYETRGFNFHTRAQKISEMVGEEFYKWIKQNRENSLDAEIPE